MNLLLQDPFVVLKDYPDKLTHTIQNPLKTSCFKFSPKGDYLAVGNVDGNIMLYDMITNKPIYILGANNGGAHIRPINDLSWGGCNNYRFLLSGGRDWYLRVWNLLEPNLPCFDIPFDNSIWGCHWCLDNLTPTSPDKSNLQSCIVTIYENLSAFWIKFNYNISSMDQNIPSYTIKPVIDSNVEKEDTIKDHGFVLTSCMHPMANDVVITGSSKGYIKFYKIDYNLGTFKLINSEKISNSNIKNIIVSQNGNKCAINCSDRTIRQFEILVNDNFRLVLQNRYQDVINKLQWNCIFFSNKSADYLVASTHGSSSYELYLWETMNGSLVRVLEGAEEELMDIDWNFYTMSIASNGFESGDIYIWSLVIPPKWSALAPDFEEIEENIDYREKEDEFDQVTNINDTSNDMYTSDDTNNEGTDSKLDFTTIERLDVRGNDLTLEQCPIPIDYERILALNERATH